MNIRREAGRMRGFILLTLRPFAPTSEECAQRQADLKRLEAEKRLPSHLNFDFDERGGRLTWLRSGASRDLSSLERERLTTLFDSLRASGQSLLEKK
jgi:hypothetical protein